jgi:hypothetical protein
MHGLYHADHVATWSEQGDYQINGHKMSASFNEALASLESQSGLYRDYWTGKQQDAGPGSGPMHDYYETVERLLGQDGLPADLKETWNKRLHAAKRLRFYIRAHNYFFATYGKTLHAAWTEVMRQPWVESPPPRREDDMKMISLYMNQLSSVTDPSSTAREAARLLDGLAQLTSDVIPESAVI